MWVLRMPKRLHLEESDEEDPESFELAHNSTPKVSKVDKRMNRNPGGNGGGAAPQARGSAAPLQEVEVEIFLQEGVLHPQLVEGQIPQI